MKRSAQYFARRQKIGSESARLRQSIGYFDSSSEGNVREAHDRNVSAIPASFRLLHESDDARFCLFETDDAHLNAVNAAHLA